MNTEEVRRNIWRIADGIPLKMENMTVRTTDSGKLLVHGWTDAVYFEDISKEKLIRDIDELKSSFSDLWKSFKELDYIVKNNNLIVEYHLAYNAKGKVEIGLCSEIEGKINWYI